jgi:endonuclease YncB( thermonuclease family)
MAVILLLLCLLAARAAWAGSPPEALPAGERERVVAVIDGDTVKLASGLSVRLVGIQAPEPPLGRPGFAPWPLGEEAKAALEALVLGRNVTLHYGGQRRDRHGRALAHLVTEEGVWAQGRLLEAGLARVYSFADNRALAAELLAREEAARTAKRGIWAEPFYAILSDREAARALDRFALIEGRVLKVAEAKGRTYLNFGEDWRQDFTISIDGPARRLFAQAGIEPETLAGHTIRVRGWLKSFNGPLIEATHPEQIERLD